MKRLLLKAALLAVIILAVPLALAGCSPDEEKFPGEKTTPYEVNSSSNVFKINLVDTDKVYLCCSVTLDITNKDDILILAEKNYWIADVIIGLGMEKTLDDLRLPNAKEIFAQQISDALSEKFNIDSIFKVSFTTFYTFKS